MLEENNLYVLFLYTDNKRINVEKDFSHYWSQKQQLKHLIPESQLLLLIIVWTCFLDTPGACFFFFFNILFCDF